MAVRATLSRRDALLFLLGAGMMHIFSLMYLPATENIIIDARLDNPVDTAALPPPPEAALHFGADPPSHTVTVTAKPEQTMPAWLSTHQSSTDVEYVSKLPETKVLHHAPGWTIFSDLYMSNGTLFVVTPDRHKFPEVRKMTSVALEALNNPENIAAREPTQYSMDFLTPEEARRRWGGSPSKGKKNRVLSVEGNTLLVNEPRQFLRHYYHLVAELFFGVQAFWHGAFSHVSSNPPKTAVQLESHPAPPPLHRVIFAASDGDGWRDDPGFNYYFLRAAYPSMTVEVEEDWEDRILASSLDYHRNTIDRAWHFPMVLLTDRSASHRGVVCGSQTQRIAAEAWHYMRENGLLMGEKVGGWWEPIRSAVLRFAEVPTAGDMAFYKAQKDVKPIVDKHDKRARDAFAELGPAAEGDMRGAKHYELPMPEKVVVSYISRQSARNRKLTDECHENLVKALQDLAKRRDFELNIVEAEHLTKDEQLAIAGRTTILLGVHGNGLTHLIWMPPTRVSAVIEMFYPGGFAHDYFWTTRALGMEHYAVWNDTYHTHKDKPNVAYPEGFQLNYIPADADTVIKIIEDRVDGRI